jgi:hypothetical protein
MGYRLERDWAGLDIRRKGTQDGGYVLDHNNGGPLTAAPTTARAVSQDSGGNFPRLAGPKKNIKGEEIFGFWIVPTQLASINN